MSLLEISEVAIPSLTEAADLWRLVLGNEMRAGLWPLVQKATRRLRGRQASCSKASPTLLIAMDF